MSDMENRIRRLEDIEEIKKLKAMYCHLVDEGVAGDKSKLDELLSLFTDDAWLDFAEFGRHDSKAAVSAFFSSFVPQVLSYSAHMVSNPLIEIDGNQATGRWYLQVPCTLRAINQPNWIQGKYIEQYRRVDGIWKWASITARFDFFTPLEEGWVKTRMPSLSA
jgi:hypothetical protein